MLYLTLLRFFFSKREGQILSNFDKQTFVHLARIQHRSVVVLALRTVFAVGFLITQFLATKALGKNTLADRR